MITCHLWFFFFLPLFLNICLLFHFYLFCSLIFFVHLVFFVFLISICISDRFFSFPSIFNIILSPIHFYCCRFWNEDVVSPHLSSSCIQKRAPSTTSSSHDATSVTLMFTEIFLRLYTTTEKQMHCQKLSRNWKRVQLARIAKFSIKFCNRSRWSKSRLT